MTAAAFEVRYASARTFIIVYPGPSSERRAVLGTMRRVAGSREAPGIEALTTHPSRLSDSDSASFMPEASCPGGLTVDDYIGWTTETPEQLSTRVKAVEAYDALR